MDDQGNFLGLLLVRCRDIIRPWVRLEEGERKETVELGKGVDSSRLVNVLPLQLEETRLAATVSLRDNKVAQKASKLLSSYSSLQCDHFHIIMSILCYV